LLLPAFCLWFDTPSFLAILLFNSLYDVCIVCYTFNIYLTTLFDVYCMLFWSIHCMHNLPTKCNVHSTQLAIYTNLSRVDTPKCPFVPALSTIPWTTFCGVTYIHVLSLWHLYPFGYLKNTNENFQKRLFLVQFFSQLYSA
jgi:hypothetical protein